MRIETVDLVEVNPVGAQPAQRRVDLLEDASQKVMPSAIRLIFNPEVPRRVYSMRLSNLQGEEP
jgi:hypothetical protein